MLDAVLRDDPAGRVACETLVNTGLVVVSGEITTTTYVDIPEVARDTIRRIGYTNAEFGFDYHTCAVINAIDKQSPDIAQGVDAAYETRHDPADDDELDVAGAGALPGLAAAAFDAATRASIGFVTRSDQPGMLARAPLRSWNNWSALSCPRCARMSSSLKPLRAIAALPQSGI